MQAHQHHRLPCTRRLPLPLPLHHRVQPNLRRHPLRHVEEHLQVAPHRPNGSDQMWNDSVQEEPSPLLRGLRQGPQGPLRRHPTTRPYYNLAHPVLRVNFPRGIRGTSRRGGQHLRTGPVRFDDAGVDCGDVASETVEVRRQQKPAVGQHPSDRRSNRYVHLQYLHHNRRPVHHTAKHRSGAGHGSGFSPANYLPDYLHIGRVQEVLRHSGSDEEETRQGNRHLPFGYQPGHVGHQYSGEIEGGVPPDPAALLRSLGVDDHHSRLYASRYLLQISLHGMPVRDLEEGL